MSYKHGLNFMLKPNQMDVLYCYFKRVQCQEKPEQHQCFFIIIKGRFMKIVENKNLVLMQKLSGIEKMFHKFEVKYCHNEKYKLFLGTLNRVLVYRY